MSENVRNKTTTSVKRLPSHFTHTTPQTHTRPKETKITSPRPGTSAGTSFLAKPDTPRSSEPILIPKLRIQFADFPYLHYSIDQRLFTLETCCGYGYDPARHLHVALSRIFKVRGEDPDTAATAVLFAFQTISPCQRIPWNSNAHTEKKTLPGSPDGVSGSFWVTPTNSHWM